MDGLLVMLLTIYALHLTKYTRHLLCLGSRLSCCSRRSLEFTQFAISNYLLMGRVNILS
uniref:Uncharacterized protein n=1 Tax=Siphoviridae sp. ctsYb1 TaxID=2825696 RepID=A0A8S5VIU9_9CAUD|nr:MAG TPA: hypothetical protein [Siphoviridae sp. ctsYb1]